MTLATDEFIRRFLIHVLPRGFHRIRHYGLFASGTAPTTSRAPVNCSQSSAPQAEARNADDTEADEPQTLSHLPVLRRPHDHHRDLRARLHAAASADSVR